NMGRDNILPKKFFRTHEQKWSACLQSDNRLGCVGLVAIFFTDNILGGVELVSFGAITGFILRKHFSSCAIPQEKGRARRQGDIELCGTAADSDSSMRIPVVRRWRQLQRSSVSYGSQSASSSLAVKTKGFRQLPPENGYRVTITIIADVPGIQPGSIR
ncbi:MAG: hypothetical protein V8R14_09365, partial [Clostridia bacterium]